MTDNYDLTPLLTRSQEELKRSTQGSEWTIRVDEYRYGENTTDHRVLVLRYCVGNNEAEHNTSMTMAMELAASYHITSVVDTQAGVTDTRVSKVGDHWTIHSICAIPIFRPDMYDPSPLMRPLLGIVSFASDLPAKQLITNERLHNKLESFAESAVGDLFRIVKASPYGEITWEQIRQDILNRLVPERLMAAKALSKVQDNSGVMWWEVKPGCFARENDIRNVLWFQERSFVGDKMDRWKPIGVYSEEMMSRVETETAIDVKRYVDAREFDKLYEMVDSLSNDELKAKKYHEAAMASMKRDDKFNSLVAAKKYKEVRGESAKTYQLLGQIYWWFEDVDTAIGYSEKARELAENERDNTLINAIKNNLAFYYAERQINKKQALEYVADIIDRTSPEASGYAAYLDTAGYVHTKFATTKADIDEAVRYYVASLELDPQETETNQHLIEALEKKKMLS